MSFQVRLCAASHMQAFWGLPFSALWTHSLTPLWHRLLFLAITISLLGIAPSVYILMRSEQLFSFNHEESETSNGSEQDSCGYFGEGHRRLTFSSSSSQSVIR